MPWMHTNQEIIECRISDLVTQSKYAIDKKQAYMAYKSRLNITAEVYWLKIRTILQSLQ